MFLTQRESTKATGIPATNYMTAKDDLNLNLIELIKARSRPAGEEKTVDPAEAAAYAAAEEAAQKQAEEEAAAAEAAAEAARLEAEAAAAAAAAEAEAATATEGDDFGEDW